MIEYIKVIRWFWLAVESMSTEERVRLLQFTTGCSRVPAQGFKALQSHDGHFRKFNIQSVSKKVGWLFIIFCYAFCSVCCTIYALN